MISVIVPYKDSENWIGRCFQSLYRQQGDFEFIFVNDHSTDRGKELLTVYVGSDDRFMLLDNQRAAGVSGARNTGLSVAHGEWVTFLDADDEMLPDVYETFIRMTRICDTANVVQANHKGMYNAIVKPNTAGLFTVSHLPNSWYAVWNKLYRRSFLQEHNIRFKEGLQYGEDELFNLTCLEYDDRIFHAQHTTCTMKHYPLIKGSLSNIKSPEQLLEQSHALEEFLLETDNKKIRREICKMLSDRWSHRLLDAFAR